MKKLMLMLLAVAAFGATASAELVHRYDFETDASDSVGTADGTIYGSATITDGGLYSGGNGISGTLVGGIPANGVGLDASAVDGITGAFTIECWMTAAYGGPFNTTFSFSDGTTSNYVLGTPARGDAPYPSSIAVIGGGGPTSELRALGRYFDTNELLHMLVSYDGTTLTYYQNNSTDFGGYNTNNSLSAIIEVPGLNLSTLTYIGINGGAPWGDNSMNGSVWDFRIYNNALSESQVAALYALGSDATFGDINSVTGNTAWNPMPEKYETMVGTVVGTGLNTSVTVDLSWNTAMEAGNPEVFDADVAMHYLYMSGDIINAENDPNVVTDMVLVASIPSTGATGSTTITGLNLDGRYSWRVDEGFINGGSVTAPTDPNTMVGPYWVFDTMPSIPVIVTNPMNGLVSEGDSYSMNVVVDSITDPVFAWYKSADRIISEDDELVGTNSNTLEFTDITLADMAYYYCSVTNDSGLFVKTKLAQLEVRTMVAQYSFEDSLINSVDAVPGIGIVGELVVETMNYGAGEVGNALVLNGVDEHVEIACPVRNSYTIELWVKTTAVANGGDWWNGIGLIDGEMTGWVPDYGTVISGNGFALGSGPSGTTIRSAKAINDGQWHYCVATREVTTGTLSVYVDGQLEATVTDKDAGVTQTATDILTVGKIRTGAGFLNGALDEIKIYNYAFDEMSIAQNYIAYEPDATVCIQTLKPEGKYDLYNDCVINIMDFAVMAGKWLDCAIYPDCYLSE